MAISWWFKEEMTFDSTKFRWTWRTLAVDGTILNTAGPFEDYGKAVGDALKHGFHPTADHWGIESAHGITHFKHGQHTAYIPKNDVEPPPVLRPLERRAERRGSRSPLRKRAVREEQ